MRSEEYRYIKTNFFGNDIYTLPIKIHDLIEITYVAVRGKSSEEGAVQRVLNRRRISQIRDFILDGNEFVNTFILNWTDSDNLPKIKKDTINIPLQGRRAQIIDGQHRITGLIEAVNINKSIGDKEAIISFAIGLNTQEAAKIFLNINSEQKPVPKSLIYDLFGEAFDDKEHAINRSKDIIDFLNSNEESPFYQKVKYPGAPRSSGMIDLSIMVNAIKPYLDKDGSFNQLKLSEIETQEKIITNFYSVLRDVYNRANRLWDKTSENPFIKAAGFSGAFEFLSETLIKKCQDDKKFSFEHMQKLMKLEPDALITASDLKNLDGKSARKQVKQFLNEAFLQDIPTDTDEYEF